MKELKELRFNDSTAIIQDNVVRGDIRPKLISELSRNVIFRGDAIVEGAIFANKFTVEKGNIEIQGAVFSQKELYVDSDYDGTLLFKKAVASADTIVSRAKNGRITFCSDINAKSVTLLNAYIAGSIYADEITLINCVVVGGVFATQDLVIESSLVGTFNSPTVQMTGSCGIFLPSAFSIEPIIAAPGAELYNYTLADLGSLFKGEPQSPESGKIKIDISAESLRTHLADENLQKTLRSYTAVGKVLGADLLDTDKFQNNFLLTSAALGPQLLKTYDFGKDHPMTPETLREFFYGILSGRIPVQEISGTFSLADFASKM